MRMIPGSFLVESTCSGQGCSAPVVAVPEQIGTALCIECGRAVQGIDWPAAQPIGQWHPTVGYSSPGLNDYVRPLIEPDPFPAPVRTSRQESAFLAPQPVLLLAEFAREVSWQVRMQYAQGHASHGSTGKPGALRDSIALRFGAHPLTERAAYACYERAASGGTWSWSTMIWGPDLPPYSSCSVTELKEFLSAPERSTSAVMAWVRGIKAVRAAQAAKVKARLEHQRRHGRGCRDHEHGALGNRAGDAAPA